MARHNVKLFPDGYSFVTSSEARVSVARVARRSVNLFSNGHNFVTSCNAYAVSPILILIISACKVLSLRSVPISRFIFCAFCSTSDYSSFYLF